MSNIESRWYDCQLLAARLKQRSLNLPLSDAEESSEDSEVAKTTAEAIADLKRRSRDLRQRYGL